MNPNLAAAHSLIGLAKLFDGHPEETESHELEALRVSPHDTEADVWVAYIALAKLYLGAYEDALDFFRRSKELNRNYATGRFNMVLLWWSWGDSMKREPKSKPGLPSIPGSPSGVTVRARKATIQFS